MFSIGMLLINNPWNIKYGHCSWFDTCGSSASVHSSLNFSNYIHYKVWDEITYPYSNFNGATVEVWEWISYFILHFTGYVITYKYWD